MSYLNELAPSTPKKNAQRVGRGMGSKGKTCGRGHKGQKSRSGGFHRIGFEGGQNPLHRRLPKFGFSSRKALARIEVRLEQLNAIEGSEVNLDVLRSAGLIKHNTKYVKIMLKGEIKKAVNIKGIGISQSAREAVLKAGGSVE
jgi:large subunit ribosomal protein L15